VGLGGRLDSTNILIPELSIVTSIGLDHCAQLGPTRAAIAREKAGIFKPGVPALVGERDAETAPVFEEVSAAAPCQLFFADSWADSLFPAGSRLPELDLRGEYQALNLRTVLAALDLMGIEPDWDALAHTAARTGLRGRWETLCSRPLTICDIGHNPPALRRNFAQLKEMMAGGRYPQLHIIYGIMADKALDDIIPRMPRDAAYYFVTPDTPRALPAAEIAARFLLAAADRTEKASAVPSAPENALDRTDQASVVPSGSGRGVRKVSVCASVAETIAQVEKNASPDDLIYIGGSTFVVCEAIRYFESL
jgi:dihydrofolate synthase/folylpolyglutamate synthase